MTETLEDDGRASHSLKKRAVTGAFWVTMETAGVQGTSFAVFATLVHFLRPHDFGLMSISFLSVQSLEMLILYNISTVAFRKQFVTDSDFTTAFWITIGLAILSCLALMASSSALAHLFRSPGLTIILRSMSVILLFIGLSKTHEAWLIRHFQFKSLAIRGIIGAMAGGVTGVVLAASGFGVFALVGQQIVNSLVCVTLLWLVCPWRPSFHFSGAAAKEIFSFMCRMVPNNLVYATNQNCDTFLVALLFGPVSAGYYNVAKRMRLALQLVSGDSIKAIGLTTLTEIQNDTAKLRNVVVKSITLISALCSPVFLGASAVSNDAICAVFGSNWANSGPILQILSIGGLAIVLLSYNDNIFVLKNKPTWCLRVSVGYSFFAITAMLVCVKLRIIALALPFVLPYVILVPFSYILVCKEISLSPRELLGALLPGLSSAAVMFAVIRCAGLYYPSHSHVFRLLILCPVGAFTYSMMMLGVWRGTAGLLISSFRHLVYLKTR